MGIGIEWTAPCPTGARKVEVIETNLERRGGGDDNGDPVRSVTQYYSLDGELLAEHDPCAGEKERHQARERNAMIARLGHVKRRAEVLCKTLQQLPRLRSDARERMEQVLAAIQAAEELTYQPNEIRKGDKPVEAFERSFKSRGAVQE